MTRWLGAVLVALLGAGCSVGVGSAYVGQWRAHDEIAYELCVENAAGECESREQVMRHLPAREYWGFTLSYPSVGVARSAYGEDEGASLRLESSAEFLQGYGRYAIGVRAGALLDLGEAALFTVPVMVVGHAGLSERFSFYGALGYCLYSVTADIPLAAEEEVSRLGWRALAGVQIVGSRTHRETRLIWNIEVDRLAVNFASLNYRSWGAMAHLGISF